MHIPVLYTEVLEALQPKPGAIFIDATLGGAGHASAILQASGPDGRLLGTDADAAAIARCTQRLSEFGTRAIVRQSWLNETPALAAELGFTQVDGVLMDLGLSSFQLDEAERGFSFMREGPLDMRFDNTKGMSAADWVNTADVPSMAQALRDYGDVANPMRVAEAIQKARPLSTTHDLRQAVLNVARMGRGGRINPATLVFQALRIVVNDELRRLSEALPHYIDLLKSGGRLAVISFHSLEDGIVKRIFRDAAESESAQFGFGDAQPVRTATVQILTKKPIQPTEAESRDNPRARSARLRVVQRI